ncbi:alpha/beta fold hydrolase [Vibrio gazogenes]|uniref:Pimeloyl-ACP methyl ester carboxylesterase n=1 Tax=Vibrio gazogenes DSM 21264 = NBRC 103151 TaxID=1123492 RepID=A0A1M4U3S4_VIBGA|nr:alpha/beta hydrolase [Vibrio gazogenes]USP16231.1 alpha/beta hydrolase [Vibrio gazogenes]SHE51294.1 Pimeloyl-ACP methyl ester carboxylesterase [Vibrio gazogenes DSM 21264] [Vibrio gazogenes DSM 21264 = NBRC 103151]SJN53160.1 acyl-CoA esterase [Vibrio gazogenes]
MEINQIILNNNLFRYSLYKNRQSESEHVVIFLLGALQEIESVDSFSRKFSEHLDCFTIEVPGTGCTKPLDASISIREQAMMLLEFIHYMGMKKIHIIALSYATAISVELCDLCPDIFSLSICGGLPSIPESGRYATKKMIAASMGDSKEFAKLFTNTMTVDNPDIPQNKAIRKVVERNISKMSPDRMNIFFENTVRLLVHHPDNIEKIKTPCTICVGEYDPYITKESVFNFSQQLKNCNFIIINNADHFVHLEHPDKLCNILIVQADTYMNLSKKLQEFV